MSILDSIRKFWKYLQRDTWDAWLVSIILIIVGIKFILFPLLSILTGSPLPLVVVESCSMYHDSSFDTWWNKNSAWYTERGIGKSDFESYSIKNGLNKGDIVLLWGYSEVKRGDIIVFDTGRTNPLIHRAISTAPISTKGDNNFGQLPEEETIPKRQVIAKAVAKVPYLGWVKLIFFEPLRDPESRGFCS